VNSCYVSFTPNRWNRIQKRAVTCDLNAASPNLFAALYRWVGSDFFGLGSGSGFILRARAFSGLKSLLNKSNFCRAGARALLHK
jgi:hypothetical protein